MTRNRAKNLERDAIKLSGASCIEGCIPEDDFKKLIDGLSEKSQQDGALPIHKIAYAMVAVVSLTGMRTSSILALRLSDISDIKTIGRGVYGITIVTKTSPYRVTYVIPSIAYNIFQKVIEYTADYRENAPQNIKEMLFITPKGKVTADAVNCIMKDVCRDVGIKEYTLRNVHKTYRVNFAMLFRDSIMAVGSTTHYYLSPTELGGRLSLNQEDVFHMELHRD
ncbi:MAG: hypothetical protein K6F95_02410 [Selenomonas sp.]|uniref:hypothetical protein n=1 Tax=Selenomonas sp. TaxID=2053611 RepID=UPI0025D5C271|nr:hypothetical protein [Selenomonas sp.]MCR5756744.1 hypothetical protein [Selenomonas sp.]